MRRLAVLLLLLGAARPGEEALIRLVADFRDGTPDQRVAAAHRIQKLGWRAWHLFLPCLDDPDPDVRQRARALWETMREDRTWWGVPAPGTRFHPETKLPLEVIDHATGAGLILVEPGRFPMGTDDGERAEGPAHEARVERAFYLGRTELTREQYRRGLPEGYAFAKGDRGGYPAAGLSWEAIQKFLAATGLRLPTEAEWEHAARVGYDARRIDDTAWHRGNGGGEPHAVGLKQANPLGFHDLLGNVAEWCADELLPYDGDARRIRATPGRAVRGGSVTRPAAECRPTFRRGFPEAYRSDTIGFRVARDP